MKNLITGMAIGIALGVLFAPEKGSKMRKKLSETGGDYLDAIKDKFGSAANGVKETENLLEKEFNKAEKFAR